MRIVRAVARLLISTLFIGSGIDVLRHPDMRAEVATDTLGRLRKRFPAIPEDDATIVRANAAVQVGAAALMARGRMPRASAGVLAASLVPTTIAGHRFWTIDEPEARAQQQVHFTKNLAVLGGLLMAMTAPSPRRTKRRKSRPPRGAERS